jgi:hypothetical protein
MRRAVAAGLLAAALGAAGCGSEETTKYCGEACDIWANCGAWDRDLCMADCTSAKDWDKAYLDCLKSKTCQTLDACG